MTGYPVVASAGDVDSRRPRVSNEVQSVASAGETRTYVMGGMASRQRRGSDAGSPQRSRSEDASAKSARASRDLARDGAFEFANSSFSSAMTEAPVANKRKRRRGLLRRLVFGTGGAVKPRVQLHTGAIANPTPIPNPNHSPSSAAETSTSHVSPPLQQPPRDGTSDGGARAAAGTSARRNPANPNGGSEAADRAVEVARARSVGASIVLQMGALDAEMSGRRGSGSGLGVGGGAERGASFEIFRSYGDSVEEAAEALLALCAVAKLRATAATLTRGLGMEEQLLIAQMVSSVRAHDVRNMQQARRLTPRLSPRRSLSLSLTLRLNCSRREA